MDFVKRFYNTAAVPLMLSGYGLFSRFNEKARGFFEIREGLIERLRERAAEAPGSDRLALFHVASVGELLMAMPLMRAVKALDDPPAVALSHTSVSVTRNMPGDVPADIVTPSPVDTREEVGRYLDALAPDLVVFSTYDLWPNLVWEASERGVNMALVNATLSEGAGRLKFPAARFYRSIYPALSAVGAITEADAERHRRLGVPGSKISVTGNCRFDQTLARCESVEADDPDLARLPDWGLTAVLGSTWPEDHARILPALSNLMERFGDLGAVIAPHEPEEARIAELERFFANKGHKTARYTRLGEGPADKPRVVLVDCLGVLFKLYKRGDMAYVGGSFKQGVHSVMEPAGMGLPVLTGPAYKNSAEAIELMAREGAASARDTAGLQAALESWVQDPEKRGRAGAAALEVVRNNAGATDRTMELLRPLLPR